MRKLLTTVISVLVSFCCMVILAAASPDTKITLNCVNRPVDQVLKEIEKQSGMNIVYKSANAKKWPKISLAVIDKPAGEVIKIVAAKVGESYKIQDNIVTIGEETPVRLSRNIAGVVIDEEGEPLPGASVVVKGTLNGVSTNIDGKFELNIDGKNPVLTISYVGMHTVEYPLSAANMSNPVRIMLRANVALMDEVVVTGYQNLKRENATGAYQTVTAAEMDKRYSGTIVDNLEGKVPGLITYNNGVKSGEDAMIIRGSSSLQATTKPLVVVDGLPIEGSIETVNPYDIANITVLKDAAASAIYGARASNGVIVITTKRATGGKMAIDFNADLTITEKNSYDNMGWATAAELIELEKYNFDWMARTPDGAQMRNLANYYNNPERRFAMQPVMRDLYANYVGDLSDSELNSRLDRYSKNDYRSEWQDVFEKTRILQQYNLGMRYKGDVLMSNLMFNYKTDNLGVINDRHNVITLKYSGEWKATKGLVFNFGINVISERSKNDVLRPSITSYSPYYSMYNPNGTYSDMNLGFDENVPAMKESSYGLKSMFYNPIMEEGLGIQRARRTNIRSYLNGTYTILSGWTVSGYFQYEDILYKSDTYRASESYAMRKLYNLYTRKESNGTISHNIPEGGRLDTATNDGAFWTFRAQSQYRTKLGTKHDIDVLAGFEFRESRTKSYNNVLIGYDDQTQTNQTMNVNWYDIGRMTGSSSIFGTDYRMAGAPNASSLGTSDVLHRFYSLYATANYVYDRKYALSASWRIDKTDLFGADPKFRGRPLWSIGASWNMHNETFMKDLTWLSALKPRVSYGLTGNIDSSVSSFLTATISVNPINQNKKAYLNTPPNDQLRWEKTSTWNFGMDFSLFDYRLNGSLDYYRKTGSDLLTYIDLDPETGWNMLTINNGNMLNHGIELQLNGQILRPRGRNTVGINAVVNFAYNKNKVTKINHLATRGYDALNPLNFKKGYPVHSLYSFDFAGFEQNGMIQYLTWRDKEGEVHKSLISSADFTPEDVLYSGSLDPKYTGSFVPEITYAGFSLSAMMSYYGGHVMRVNTIHFSGDGDMNGYNIAATQLAIPSSYLDYWRTGDTEKYMANGAPGAYVSGKYQASYTNSNVVQADYFKLRNIVVGYTLPQQMTKKIGINTMRLRVQFNNVATWVKNEAGKDPEAVNPISGADLVKTPRSYTFGLLLNL